MFTKCQPESEHFVNVAARLDRLRKAKGMSWEELAHMLDLSRTMLHYLRKGTRELGIKAQHRLLHAEREAGIETREEALLLGISRAASIAKANQERMVPEEILREEYRATELEDEVAKWKKRALSAEGELAAIRSRIEEFQKHIRSERESEGGK